MAVPGLLLRLFNATLSTAEVIYLRMIWKSDHEFVWRHSCLIRYYPCTGALSLGVKRPGCEADHSPPSSAEVKE
jgi:hypothetical protein